MNANATKRMSGYRLMIWVILVTVFFSLNGCIKANAPINGDSRRVLLSGDWKVRQGGDMSYASPGFDDSNWGITDAPANLYQVPFFRQGSETWYRKWFYLPTESTQIPLGLELGKIIGADEVYINGYRIGRTASSRFQDLYLEKTRIYLLPEHRLHPGAYNLIAVRIQPTTIEAGGIYEGQIAVDSFANLMVELMQREALALVFCAVFLIIGLYALSLFTKRTQSKVYLFFGLGAINTGVYAFYISQWRFILGMESFCDPRVYYLTTFLVVPIFLCFTYELFPCGQPETQTEKLFRKFTRWLLGYTVLLCLALLIYNDDRAWEFMSATPNVAVIFVSSCIGVFYAIGKFDRKDSDSIMMLCGCVIGFLGGLTETLRQYYPEAPPYAGMWGVVGCVFAQAMILSNRFWRLHHRVEEYSQSLERMVDQRTEQLKVAEESRRRLLSNISHDLRTPVSSVLGHVELMLEDVVESPEQQREYLRRIHAKMLGMNRLIQDLFELSKIESTFTSFHWSEISAQELVKLIWQKYVSDVENAGCRLEYSSHMDQTVRVRGDPDRLDQVFANLIANAIRYIGKDGRIMISCEWAKDMHGTGRERKVLFKIADNGVGIAPEEIPKVFDRFYRGSHARENTSEHSGLGLAIAKEIVEAHRGRIWVDENVEAGCVFCILLPVSQ